MGKAYLGLSEEWSHELQRRRVSSKMEYVFVCNQRGQTHLRNSRCELELTVAANDSQLIANFLRTLEIDETRERRKSRSRLVLATREIGEMGPDPPTDQKVVGSNPAERTKKVQVRGYENSSIETDLGTRSPNPSINRSLSAM